jgi:hypothetical protein
MVGDKMNPSRIGAKLDGSAYSFGEFLGWWFVAGGLLLILALIVLLVVLGS